MMRRAGPRTALMLTTILGLMAWTASTAWPARGATIGWTPTGSLVTARAAHSATPLRDGRILVAGGCCLQPGHLASAEIYDPTSGTWTSTGSMGTARANHTATPLPDGRVLVAG